MSKNTPEQQNSEEIDLGVLFNAIGNAFNKLFNFIGRIFKAIFSVFIYALKAIVVNYKPLMISMIAAGIVGCNDWSNFIANSNKFSGSLSNSTNHSW